MRSRKIWPDAAAGALCALLATLSACGPRHDLPPRPALEEEKTAHEEGAVQLPAYPKPENLAQLELGDAGNFDYFVDTESISIAGQSDYRFTLVARSRSGATNVSYEGLRCLSRERRVYALGRSDGTWVAARKSEWTPFSRAEAQRQIHAALAQDYLCPERRPLTNVQEIVQAVRYGGRR